MNNPRTLVSGLLALGVASFATTAPAADNCFLPPMEGKTIEIKGSTTLRPIAGRAKSLFNKFNPDLTVNLEAFGSTTGIRALIEGACAERGLAVAGCDLNADGKLDPKADIAQASRPIKQNELDIATRNGLCIVESQVAKDGLGPIVHPTNGVPRLNQADMKFLFETNVGPGGVCGASRCRWVDLGLGTSTADVWPISRTPESGTFGAFVDLYGVNRCKLAGTQVNSIEPGACALPDNPSVCFVGSNDEQIAAVEGQSVTCRVNGSPVTLSLGQGAVAYVGISFLTPGVRAVPAAKQQSDPAVVASFLTVQNGTFPFSRGLFTYTVGVPTGDDPRAAWLSYILGPLGQANVFEIDFVPIAGAIHLGGPVGGPMVRDVETVTQATIEPHGAWILKNDPLNIADRLDLIAASFAILNDPLATTSRKFDAQINYIESQFALEEYYTADNTLVRNLLDRAAALLLACSGNGSKSAADLAAAETAWAQAQAALAACSPTFPTTCTLAEYQAWLGALETAFHRGAQSAQECSNVRVESHGRSRF